MTSSVFNIKTKNSCIDNVRARITSCKFTCKYGEYAFYVSHAINRPRTGLLTIYQSDWCTGTYTEVGYISNANKECLSDSEYTVRVERELKNAVKKIRKEIYKRVKEVIANRDNQIEYELNEEV